MRTLSRKIAIGLNKAAGKIRERYRIAMAANVLKYSYGKS
jgi:hypothetical protein